MGGGAGRPRKIRKGCFWRGTASESGRKNAMFEIQEKELRPERALLVEVVVNS